MSETKQTIGNPTEPTESFAPQPDALTPLGQEMLKLHRVMVLF